LLRCGEKRAGQQQWLVIFSPKVAFLAKDETTEAEM
jgi:hypothetical protein